MAKIKTKSGVTKCRVCLRSVDEAIAEQLALGEVCDNDSCAFRQVIIRAIHDVRSAPYCIRCGAKYNNGDAYCIICGNKRFNDR